MRDSFEQRFSNQIRGLQHGQIWQVFAWNYKIQNWNHSPNFVFQFLAVSTFMLLANCKQCQCWPTCLHHESEEVMKNHDDKQMFGSESMFQSQKLLYLSSASILNWSGKQQMEANESFMLPTAVACRGIVVTLTVTLRSLQKANRIFVLHCWAQEWHTREWMTSPLNFHFLQRQLVPVLQWLQELHEQESESGVFESQLHCNWLWRASRSCILHDVEIKFTGMMTCLRPCNLSFEALSMQEPLFFWQRQSAISAWDERRIPMFSTLQCIPHDKKFNKNLQRITFTEDCMNH